MSDEELIEMSSSRLIECLGIIVTINRSVLVLDSLLCLATRILETQDANNDLVTGLNELRQSADFSELEASDIPARIDRILAAFDPP
jgi:hypothetical protein